MDVHPVLFTLGKSLSVEVSVKLLMCPFTTKALHFPSCFVLPYFLSGICVKWHNSVADLQYGVIVASLVTSMRVVCFPFTAGEEEDKVYALQLSAKVFLHQ